MKMIRTQLNVPDVYVNRSRDFQLLCRLYDCLINGTKFEADALQFVTDTDFCGTRLLQLLQTKLGFFTNADITDDELRMVLDAFPFIVKNKGSLKAIKQALYVFLKINHLNTEIDINIINQDPTSPYTIRIGIRSGFRDTTILDEIFRYILPAGYLFEYIFYTSLKGEYPVYFMPKAEVLYVEDLTNSQVRGNSYGDPTQNRLINAAAMAEVLSEDATLSLGGNIVATEGYMETAIPGFYNLDDGLFYYSKVVTVVGGVPTTTYEDTISGVENQKYFDKDTETVYFWNGSSFEVVQ